MITPDFLLTVVIASSSGALTPGPLFLASTLRATRSGWIAGVECALGHTLVELPLVIGLAVGLSSYLLGSVRVIGVVGGATLFAFGAIQILHARRPVRLDEQQGSKWDQRSGVIVGLVFTGINPFFLIWWATVGSLLIAEALLLGAFLGVIIMFAAHVWMDYAWLGGTAILTAKGRSFIGKWYRILLIVFGIGMLYFGTKFIISGLS